jgi:hypothetical protein
MRNMMLTSIAASVLSAAALIPGQAGATPLGATIAADGSAAVETAQPVGWWGGGYYPHRFHHRPFFFHHRPFFRHRYGGWWGGYY